MYKTKKLLNFIKRKQPENIYHGKSHLIYKYTCTCNSTYIGQTKRYFNVRIDEHRTNPSSHIFKHYSVCPEYKKELIKSYATVSKIRSINQVPKKHKNEFFRDKFQILCRENDYKLRLAKENIFIKLNSPDLNDQTDLSKPLHNFV